MACLSLYIHFSDYLTLYSATTPQYTTLHDDFQDTTPRMNDSSAADDPDDSPEEVIYLEFGIFGVLWTMVFLYFTLLYICEDFLEGVEMRGVQRWCRLKVTVMNCACDGFGTARLNTTRCCSQCSEFFFDVMCYAVVLKHDIPFLFIFSTSKYPELGVNFSSIDPSPMNLFPIDHYLLLLLRLLFRVHSHVNHAMFRPLPHTHATCTDRGAAAERASISQSSTEGWVCVKHDLYYFARICHIIAGAGYTG